MRLRREYFQKEETGMVRFFFSEILNAQSWKLFEPLTQIFHDSGNN